MKIKISKELEEIIPNFLLNREKDFVILSVSIAAEDYIMLETIGHRLAGSAKSYGFDDLGVWGREIEYAAKNKEIEIIKECVKKMKSYMDSIEIEFI